MKYIMILLVVILVLFVVSCAKNSVPIIKPSGSIMGKWNLESDNTFQGVGSSNHPVNYIGQAGDYFDFRADGNVYTKENTVFDTLSYTIVSNSSIIIASFGITLNGIPEISSITTLTSYNAVITAPVLDLPAGQFGRTVHLSR